MQGLSTEMGELFSFTSSPVSLSSAKATKLYHMFGNLMNTACLHLPVICGREVAGA